MTTRPVYPLPEAITEERWAIREGPAYIDFVHRRLSAPLAAGPRACFQRTHEEGHLRWTPAEDAHKLAQRWQLDWEVMQAVEDCRIHALLDRAGVDLSSGGVAPERIQLVAQKLRTRGHLRRAALCAVAAYATGDYPALATGLACGDLDRALELAAEARSRLLAGPLHEFARTVEVTRWLQELLPKSSRSSGPGPGGPPGPGAGASETTDSLDDDLPALYDGAEPPPEGGGSADETAGRAGASPVPRMDKPHLIPWGEMVIQEPPRPLAAVSWQQGPFRAADLGSGLRYPHRLLLDQRVFGRKRRFQGGSLLIDWSGSMRLSDADVATVLAQAPVCTVAVYSADHSRGVLKVLAHGGKRVRPADVTRPAGLCNVIDGPALDWLARQGRPRVWLGDGVVTGVGDVTGKGNTEQTEETCRRAGITRVPTVAGVLQFLRAQRKGGVAEKRGV